MGMTQKDILHSFAVLAYQDSPFLDECIQSLLQQDSACSLIYISTSCGNSSIKHVSEKYNIPLFINSSGSGIASDWSFAYNMALTKYVTLAHQDDIYLPGYTQACLKSAEQYSDNLITFTDCYEIYGRKFKFFTPNLTVKRMILFPFFALSRKLSSVSLKRLSTMFGNPICCPTVMYNSENIGNYVFDSSFKINLDWDLWIKLAGSKGSFVYVHEKLIGHRIHQSSETAIGVSGDRKKKEDLEMFKRLWPAPIIRLILFFYAMSYTSYKKNEVK